MMNHSNRSLRRPWDPVRVCFLISFGAASVQFLTDPVISQEFDPTSVKGDLQKIKEPIGKLIKLKSKNGRLAPEFEKDRQTAYAQVNQINSIGGNRGGGSSSSGTNWEIRVNSNSFEGIVNFGYSRVYPKPNPNTWKIKLKELKAPNRDLYIEATEKGKVSVTLNGGDDPYLLRIRQQPSGSIFVQEVSDTFIFSKSAPSFDAFCRQNSKFTQNRLLPMIRHLGIDAPMTQFDKVVQKSVIAFLKPIPEDELVSFQTSFKNLDSEDYAAREADSKKLEKGFDKWKGFVMRAINDAEFSPELRFRLMKVLEKNGKPEDYKASSFAISTDLANNPQYLIWLYESNSDAATRANILRRLKKATGVDLGQEIAAWKSKYDDKVTEVKESNLPPVDLMAEKGELSGARRFLGELVKLTLKGDRVKLDRGFWSEQFDNKSIQQIVKETNEQLAKLNMPENYDPDPLFELGSVGHPQAIFAKLRSAMQSKTKSSTVYYHSYNRTSSSSLNRDFSNGELAASMRFEPTAQRVVRRVSGKKKTDVKPPDLDGKPFKLDVSELKSPRRTILVHEQKDGRLRIALVTEESNSIVQFLQQPDGEFVVQDVRGAEIFTAKGKSFAEFRQNHADYCRNKLFPLFDHFGLKFSKELFVSQRKPQTEPQSDESSQSKPKATKRSQVIEKRQTIVPAVKTIRLQEGSLICDPVSSLR